MAAAAREAGLSSEVAARVALRACSFAGETLVKTENGYLQIQDIKAGEHRVWARDELTGSMDWQDVLAQYSNRYNETVHVTAVDYTGREQTITSSRIHPYFARVATSAYRVASDDTEISSEGRVYWGDIENGAWVDTQHLKAGDELLTSENRWQKVESAQVQ